MNHSKQVVDAPVDSVALNSLVICIPVYNDWFCASKLIEQLDSAAAGRRETWTVCLINDGSTSPPPDDLCPETKALDEIFALNLRTNLGHQRALAVGLTWVYENTSSDAILVMDGDGEDKPDTIGQLLEQYMQEGGTRMVFAKRARRCESLSFRFFYHLYKVVHFILTGRKVEVGNFSVMPRPLLARLVGASHLWSHYAATAVKNRLPISKVPIARGTRIDGKSKMNFVSLVLHGLSAIFVYGDEVGIRLLIAALSFSGLSALGLVAVFTVKFYTTLAIPGWATTAAGLFALLTLNGLMLSFFLCFAILQRRNNSDFIPLRDYPFYVGNRTHLKGPSR